MGSGAMSWSDPITRSSMSGGSEASWIQARSLSWRSSFTPGLVVVSATPHKHITAPTSAGPEGSPPSLNESFPYPGKKPLAHVGCIGQAGGEGVE